MTSVSTLLVVVAKKNPSGMNGGHLNEVIKWERPKEVG